MIIVSKAGECLCCAGAGRWFRLVAQISQARDSNQLLVFDDLSLRSRLWLRSTDVRSGKSAAVADQFAEEVSSSWHSDRVVCNPGRVKEI